MLNVVVSNGNAIAGRMLAGMLTMSLDHPFLLCAILAGLAGAAFAVLIDMVGRRILTRQGMVAGNGRPIKSQG